MGHVFGKQPLFDADNSALQSTTVGPFSLLTTNERHLRVINIGKWEVCPPSHKMTSSAPCLLMLLVHKRLGNKYLHSADTDAGANATLGPLVQPFG